MIKIILNSIKCNECKEIIISHHRHDFNVCKCGSTCVDGGRDYCRRSSRPGTSYRDLTVYSDAPFEIIRESFYRGTRGKEGDKELKWVLLKDMSDQWIKQVILYNREFVSGNGNEYYVKELNYRLDNNITIKD